MTIRSRVNGQERELAAGTCLQELVDGMVGEERGGLAVAVNRRVVPRGEWQDRVVEAGDEVEIIAAFQGG